MLADALGRPLRFILTPGQTGDITQAPALLASRTQTRTAYADLTEARSAATIAA